MILPHNYNHSHLASQSSSLYQRQIFHPQYSNESKQESRVRIRIRVEYGRKEAEQFAPLASKFQRRLLLGIGSASVVAVGANFCGITSLLLGISPEISRNLNLDVIYPIQGYSRYIDPNDGFEFMYPASWVADQTLLYRAAERAELERSLDPPPLNSDIRRKKTVNEPTITFGPPGSTGELNLSVIVSTVPPDFSIEAFGGAKEVGDLLMGTITSNRRGPDVKAMLLRSNKREDLLRNVNYYELEFGVEGSSFRRHNIAVCCSRNGRLYTLAAQAPESEWPRVKEDFNKIKASFSLTS